MLHHVSYLGHSERDVPGRTDPDWADSDWAVSEWNDGTFFAALVASKHNFTVKLF